MELGTRENPYLVAPNDFDKNGVPYGAFCKCGSCNLVERSTIAFDFYADKAGDKFRCETCLLGISHESVKPLIDQLEQDGAFD